MTAKPQFAEVAQRLQANLGVLKQQQVHTQVLKIIQKMLACGDQLTKLQAFVDDATLKRNVKLLDNIENLLIDLETIKPNKFGIAKYPIQAMFDPLHRKVYDALQQSDQYIGLRKVIRPPATTLNEQQQQQLREAALAYTDRIKEVCIDILTVADYISRGCQVPDA